MVSSYGQNWAFWTSCSQDPTFIKPFSLSKTSGITSIATLQPNESTSKAIFNPNKVLSKTVGFYGQTRPLRENCSQDQTLMEPISLYSTSGMNSNDNLQPGESTSKAISNPIKVLSKTVSFYGQTRAERVNCSQDATFMKPISLSSTLGWLSVPFMNPLRLLPKPSSTPKSTFKDI